MLAKVIAWAPDRRDRPRPARRRARRTPPSSAWPPTSASCGRCWATPTSSPGRLDTGLVERRGEALTLPEPPAAARVRGRRAGAADRAEPAGPVVDRWDVPDGWRLGEPAWTVRRLQATGGEPVTVRVRGRSGAAEVRVGDGEPVPARAFRDGDRLTVTLDGLTTSLLRCARGRHRLAGRRRARGRAARSTSGRRRRPTAAAGDGVVTAPMPGTVTVVQASVGDEVAAGTRCSSSRR